MNQEEPEVARYEIQNALWWIGATGIDGIRQDRIQYLPRSLIHDLSDAFHRQYPKMWMVGEVFERDAAQTAFFIGGHTGWDNTDTRLDSVFDFSLWNDDVYVFARQDQNETVVIAINRADKEKKVIVPAGYSLLTSLIGSVGSSGFLKGSTTLTLPKSSASALLVH